MSEPTIRDVIAEMQTMARVAGQASVEDGNPLTAAADGRFADYCVKWADRLLAAPPGRQAGTASAEEGGYANGQERKDDVAWVIERDIASRRHYWTGEAPPRTCPWTEKHEDALRFSRRTDAERMLTWHCQNTGRVVEHVWVAPGTRQEDR